MRNFILIFFFFCVEIIPAQGFLKKHLPRSAFTLQYAGSTGFLSAGYGRITADKKLELSLMYGNVPRFAGRPLHSVSFKFSYNPFHLEVLNKLIIEPVQAGFFVAQNFGQDLGLQWGKEYPPKYYWWARSTRFHAFVATQLSYQFKSKHFDRVSCYFEANTNDLYIASYQANPKSLSVYDILFFGTGLKLYLQ